MLTQRYKETYDIFTQRLAAIYVAQHLPQTGFVEPQIVSELTYSPSERSKYSDKLPNSLLQPVQAVTASVNKTYSPRISRFRRPWATHAVGDLNDGEVKTEGTVISVPVRRASRVAGGTRRDALASMGLNREVARVSSLVSKRQGRRPRATHAQRGQSRRSGKVQIDSRLLT